MHRGFDNNKLNKDHGPVLSHLKNEMGYVHFSHSSTTIILNGKYTHYDICYTGLQVCLY